MRHDITPFPANSSPSRSSLKAPVEENWRALTDIMGWRENTHRPLPMIALCVRREGGRERELVCVVSTVVWTGSMQQELLSCYM